MPLKWPLFQRDWVLRWRQLNRNANRQNWRGALGRTVPKNPLEPLLCLIGMLFWNILPDMALPQVSKKEDVVLIPSAAIPPFTAAEKPGSVSISNHQTSQLNTYHGRLGNPRRMLCVRSVQVLNLLWILAKWNRRFEGKTSPKMIKGAKNLHSQLPECRL